MGKVLVNMFEVQLGAALLLRFQVGKKDWVTVLADAGVHASGYLPEHVHKKVLDVLGEDRRIDLIIGTHYDADHLSGLVPIIEDPTIEIGEAWMPPVANDTDVHALEDLPTREEFLAIQFAADDEGKQLEDYLRVKQDTCEELRGIERMGHESVISDPEVRSLFKRRGLPLHQEERSDQSRFEDKPDRYFKNHVIEANQLLPPSYGGHADEDPWAPVLEPEDFEEIAHTWEMRHFVYGGTLNPKMREDTFKRLFQDIGSSSLPTIQSLAYIRRSTAREAINAISLSKVVTALKKKGTPISCQYVQDGSPRRYVWKSKGRCFVPGRALRANGIELKLLGPSQGLIKKHWDRLPIGEYMSLAFTTIPIKSITPSNQLSYVVRFGYDEQGILVTGDAGCVDFKPKRGPYYPDLLNALLPLHVIQVAHHGGNNAHFYRVLLEAQYAEQADPSYLLLSHATDDTHRPSDAFGFFISEVRKEGDDAWLLFTSTPKEGKVSAFKELIHAPVGTRGKVGDVAIEYDGAAWQVLKHAIKV